MVSPSIVSVNGYSSRTFLFLISVDNGPVSLISNTVSSSNSGVPLAETVSISAIRIGARRK